MSIFTFGKPVPNISESDWYYKITELKESCGKSRRNAFTLRNESHRLRNETDLTTYWGTKRTNSNIIDRYVFTILLKSKIYITFIFQTY